MQIVHLLRGLAAHRSRRSHNVVSDIMNPRMQIRVRNVSEYTYLIAITKSRAGLDDQLCPLSLSDSPTRPVVAIPNPGIMTSTCYPNGHS